MSNCAFGCSSTNDKGQKVYYYSFPWNKERRAKWLKAIEALNITPTDKTCICDRHFVTGKPNISPKHCDYAPTLHLIRQLTEDETMLQDLRKTQKRNCTQSASSTVTSICSNKPIGCVTANEEKKPSTCITCGLSMEEYHSKFMCEVRLELQRIRNSTDPDLRNQTTGSESGLLGGCENESRVKCQVEECADINDNTCQETSSQLALQLECTAIVTEDESVVPSLTEDYLAEQSENSLHESISDQAEHDEFAELIRRCYPKSSSSIIVQPINQNKQELQGNAYGRQQADASIAGLKPRIRCPLCGYIFHSLHGLRRHVKCVHINDRKLHCSHCQYTCNITEALNRHIKRVHKTSIHSLDVCNNRGSTEGQPQSQQESRAANSFIMSQEPSINQPHCTNTGQLSVDSRLDVTEKLNFKKRLRSCSVVLHNLDINSILRSGIYLTTDAMLHIATFWAKGAAEGKSTIECVKRKSVVQDVNRKSFTTSQLDDSSHDFSDVKMINQANVSGTVNSDVGMVSDLSHQMNTCSPCSTNSSETLSVNNEENVEHLDSLTPSEKPMGVKVKKPKQVTVYEDLPFRCDECSYSAKDCNSLLFHFNVMHLKQADENKCRFCGLTFTKKFYLAKHISKEHEVRRYSCPKCGEKFASNQARARHWVYAHVGMKTYSCDQCDFKSSHYSSLTLHKGTAHPRRVKAEKRFCCTECDYKCTCEAHLRTHIKAVHDKERLCLCPHCGKSYANNSRLNNHLRTMHSSSKPFACTECSSKFTIKSKLEKHIKGVHRKEKPYSCLLCSKKFSQPFNVRLHVNTVHNGLKPFQCQLCDKRFSQKSSFKSHMKTNHSASDNESLFTKISNIE